jgi:NAD(P)H-dependent flavin oxidoreductase YrpB (nitropropane dioxygenase family)
MIATTFTKLIGCTVPIQLAPMPGIATVELATAVADAGALGMIGAPMLPPPLLETLLQDLRKRTRGVFGVGFLMPFLDTDCLAIAAENAPVVEFFYGQPDAELIAAVHAGGALAGWQIGSKAEARQAVDAGCDYIAAQGTEAGGHIRGRIGLLPLLSEVLDAVTIPVLAAGGIATARDLAAVLAAGAAGARMGTRFVASAESGAHPEYVRRLLAADAEDTVITEAFSVMWPNAPHRVLRSSIVAAMELQDESVGEASFAGMKMPVPRLSVISPTAQTTGSIEAMALYAGESVANVTRVQAAAEIVREISEGAETLLRAGTA